MSNLVRAVKAHKISTERAITQKPLSILMHELVSVSSNLTSNYDTHTKVYEIGVRFGKK